MVRSYISDPVRIKIMTKKEYLEKEQWYKLHECLKEKGCAKININTSKHSDIARVIDFATLFGYYTDVFYDNQVRYLYIFDKEHKKESAEISSTQLGYGAMSVFYTPLKRYNNNGL